MERRTLTKIHERLLKAFMDMVILEKLLKSNPLGGYQVIKHFHKKFGILVSSGTVYAVLYSMERNGLIKGMQYQGKRVYKLTNKGEKTIKDFISVYKEIQNFTKVLLSG